MKKLFLVIIMLISASVASAQIGFTWCETFDAPSLDDSVTSWSSNPPANAGWSINSRLQVSPGNCDSAYVTTGDTVILTTVSIDFTAMTYVILEFDQICKVDFFDASTIEVSPDGGTTWLQLTDNEYLTDDLIPPGAPFGIQNNQFSAASYSTWLPANPAAIPDNTWWKHEIFDISAFAGTFNDVKIRFILMDANIPGGNGNNGWKLDNICIAAAPCELMPPALTQLPPVLQGTVYNLGPFTLNADATDNSGIASVILNYSVNGSAYTAVTMTNISGNTYSGQIPAVADSDTVCYYFVCTDASACNNQVTSPTLCFVSKSGISFPFCDNYDSQNLWTASATSGSQFQLGAPGSGIPNTPHSPPDVWDVALNSLYVDNTECYLTSPVFSFIGITGADISMWINYNTEVCCDYARVEYSLDGTTWTTLNNPGNTQNWYNVAGGWGGTSTGWMQAKCLQPAALNNEPYVQFRFYFYSDFSIVFDGFAVDDFCVLPPAPFDAGIETVVQPCGNAPAGNCVSPVFVIKNFGLNALTSMNVFYSVNSTSYGPFTWTGNLAPGQTITDTLPCFTIPAGAFTFCVWTSLTGDGNNFNDTLCCSSVGVPVIPLSYTSNYCDDFEGSNIGWSVINSGNTGTTWQLGTPAYGTTTGAHSGVQAWDINLTSAYTNNADVALYSPIFDFATGPANDVKLSFWIRFNTETAWDGVRLEYSTNGTLWSLLGTVGSPNPPYVNWYTNTVICSNQPAWAGSSTWIQAQMLNLGSLVPTLNGQPAVQFRFTFCSDASVILDGFTIDDFCLEVPVPLTASPTSISNSSSGFPCIFEGQNVTFSTTIKNKGTIALNSVNVELRIDNNTVLTDLINYSPVLAPGASQVHVFSVPWIATPGTHTVCAITNSPNGQNDLNPTDDTVCYVVQVCDTVGIASGGSYCNDFESGPSWAAFNALTFGTDTVWELGTPAQPPFNTAHSGTKAWMTGLTFNYPNNDTSGLFTPAFNIQGGENYRIRFWHEFKTEIYQDGGVVDYTTDYGATWSTLGNAGQGIVWYNTYFITAMGGNPPGPGWSGNSSTWNYAEHGICFDTTAAMAIMFRFRFRSDQTVTDIGWVIDDFCFEDMNTSCLTGIAENGLAGNFSLGQNFPNPADGTTTIGYAIPAKGNVQLNILNVLGQAVNSFEQPHQPAGRHAVSFNTRNLSAGIYFYELVFEKQKLVKKMVVVD